MLIYDHTLFVYLERIEFCNMNMVLIKNYDVAEEDDISSFYKVHFEHILNNRICNPQLKESVVTKFLSNKYDENMMANCKDIRNIIENLKCDKSFHHGARWRHQYRIS